jgi:fatty-acyl-CoA synthase
MESTMMSGPLLISRLLEYGSREHGVSEVVTWTADGPRRSTYADVGKDCARLAHALRGLGIDGDQRVGTFMWNNEEHLEAYMGVQSMGAVLHAINIRLFPEQMVYVCNHAEDEIVIVDNTLAGPFAKLVEHLPLVRHVILNGPVSDEVREALGGGGKRVVHDYRELLDAQPDTFDWPLLDERAPAAMCYTSGTTGNPKGVVYSHRSNFLHTLSSVLPSGFDLHQSDRVLAIVPLFHANAWGLPYAGLLTGASMIMPDRFLQAEPLAQMIHTEKVTASGAVPTIFTDLLHYLDDHPEIDTSTIRHVIIGGSAAAPSLQRALQERHNITVRHAWGMTEMSPLGTVAVPPVQAEGDDEWAYRDTQGRLAALVDARLVGPDGTLMPWDGESVGELQVRGPWVTGSYYVRGPEDETENQVKFDDGWLRTGDVGSLTHDGFLRLTDRAKDVIKSGGEWISSVDLENHLMAHPKVLEASVVGVPDEKWGERPLASVVVAQGESLDAVELRDYLAGRVAKWQVPERWAFIDEVPKTSVGKFDKKVLRQRYAEGELDVKQL